MLCRVFLLQRRHRSRNQGHNKNKLKKNLPRRRTLNLHHSRSIFILHILICRAAEPAKLTKTAKRSASGGIMGAFANAPPKGSRPKPKPEEEKPSCLPHLLHITDNSVSTKKGFSTA
jgi:hypothetical protein